MLMQGLLALTCQQVNQFSAPAGRTNAGAVGWADNVCLIHFRQRESGNGVLGNKKDC